jgi:lysophospholipase L1-like esterase
MTLLRTEKAWELPADDPRVTYEGRYKVGSDHRVIMGFPGVIAHLKANSKALRARIVASTDDVYFSLSIDGNPPTRIRLKKGMNEVPLLENAGEGPHGVRLVRRTEGWEGVCEILGYDVGSGELVAASELPRRKLLFIGDSITCGEGTEEADVPGSPGAERSNAAASFGMKLATRLDSQVHLVSYGGRGIIRDWQGNRATNNAPVFYELALPDDPKSAWSHANYVPDAVGICLGTNDFSPGIPERDEFVSAFAAFVRKVRRDAQGAPVVLIDSPILDDVAGELPKLSVCRAYLDEIVKEVGAPGVVHVPINHCEGSPGDGHPTAAEHTLMADKLEPVFRKALNLSSS